MKAETWWLPAHLPEDGTVPSPQRLTSDRATPHLLWGQGGRLSAVRGRDAKSFFAVSKSEDYTAVACSGLLFPASGLLAGKFLKGFLGPNFPFKDPKRSQPGGGCSQRAITTLSN